MTGKEYAKYFGGKLSIKKKSFKDKLLYKISLIMNKTIRSKSIKKILIIADRVHAQPRMTSLAEQFIKLGKEVEIYSFSSIDDAPHTLSNIPNNTKFIDEIIDKVRKNNFIKSLIGIIKYLLFFPDKYFFKWFLARHKEIDALIIKFNPDVVISSSSPVSAHLIAWRVAKKFDLKWCADFRDMWSLNHNHQGKFIGRAFDAILEKAIIKDADWVVTTTPVWAETLTKFYNKKVYSITNGFCDEKYSNVLEEKVQNSTIRYTGNIYRNIQRLTFTLFLEALCTLRDERIVFEIYGPTYPWLYEEIEKYNLDAIVKILGPVPSEDIPTIQMSASLNIIFGCSYDGFAGGYYLKMFEYLGARRPILLISDKRYRESSADLLEAFDYTYEASTVDEIIASIKKALKYSVTPDHSKINSFRYSSLAKQYLEVIHD